MKVLRAIAKWGAILYIVQALVGAAVGIYIAINHPDVLERMVSCVAH